MKATAVREKRQTTLPADICEAAGIKPFDQIEWRFEGGEIRGRKLIPAQPIILDVGDLPDGGILPKGLADGSDRHCRRNPGRDTHSLHRRNDSELEGERAPG
jgi:bifunctional DNA-binding transcriptional regulator/antitoxin component of YhaV-PrlF toxin-antitoxin module